MATSFSPLIFAKSETMDRRRNDRTIPPIIEGLLLAVFMAALIWGALPQ